MVRAKWDGAFAAQTLPEEIGLSEPMCSLSLGRQLKCVVPEELQLRRLLCPPAEQRRLRQKPSIVY